MKRPWRLSLRARITVAFSLLALLVSVGLGVSAYSLARTRLLDNTEATSVKGLLLGAGIAATSLRSPAPDVDALLDGPLRPPQGGFVIVVHNGVESREPIDSTPIGTQPLGTVLSLSLREAIAQGSNGRQRIELGGQPFVVGVVTLPGDLGQATYIQGTPLREVNNTLRFLGTSLAIGAAIATLGGAGIGLWASRRVLSPLARVTEAASQLARAAETSKPESDGLEARLDESDRELQRLASAFNHMVDAVQNRIRREQRFASDVSHELRTPLQAMLTSIGVLENRKDDLPERSRTALTTLASQTRRFNGMVGDLLEMSRLDAGAADLHTEPFLLDQFIVKVANKYEVSDVPVITESAWQHTPVLADRRRFEQVLANLFVNARNHGGGMVKVTIEGGQSPTGKPVARVGVEDAGPGVGPSDRERIFERFARGAGARQRPGTSGTGLGLSLVHEHMALLNGRVWVEDRPNGVAGARFVVELPVDVQ